LTDLLKAFDAAVFACAAVVFAAVACEIALFELVRADTALSKA
jgi:hypothetical protein